MMKSFFTILLYLIVIFPFKTTEATTIENLFKKYNNQYFIESNSDRGDGIKMALTAHFENIYSIGLNPQLYKACFHRFQTNKNVHLFLGNAWDVLPIILNRINTPATFWLNGCYSNKKVFRGKVTSSLFEELNAIQQHHIKTHTLLLDNAHTFGTIQFNFITFSEISKKILEINPNYKLQFEHGRFLNDVLVAYVPIEAKE